MIKAVAGQLTLRQIGAATDISNPCTKIQAIIFDMDGLMLDTEPLYRTVWKRAAADCGYIVTDDIYRGLVGRGRKVAEQILLQTFGPDFPMEKFQRLSCADEVHAFSFEPVAKKPGLDELLSFVESQKLPKAVATSTERAIALPLLARMGLLSRFDAVATGDEVTRGKPFPDLFLLAANRLGVEPTSCLVLEDSEAGVMAASAAGMAVFMVPDLVTPSAEVERAATRIFSSLFDVAKSLEKSGIVPQEGNREFRAIKTARLVAFPLCELDRRDLRTMDSDPQTMATLGGIRSEEETQRWLRENLKHWNLNRFGTWIFRDAADGQVAGRAGLRRTEVEEVGEIELGYSLASNFWGQGLATEMAKAILARGHESVQLDRVIALIDAKNLRSQRVAAKLGFRFERNVIWKDLPMMLYRLNSHQRANG